MTPAVAALAAYAIMSTLLAAILFRQWRQDRAAGVAMYDKVELALLDMTIERNKLAKRSVESNLRLRAGNIVVPIYKPVAVIEAEGSMTIKDYDVIKRDGSILASNTLAHPVGLMLGDTLTMDFELLIQVSPMKPEQQ